MTIHFLSRLARPVIVLSALTFWISPTVYARDLAPCMNWKLAGVCRIVCANGKTMRPLPLNGVACADACSAAGNDLTTECKKVASRECQGKVRSVAFSLPNSLSCTRDTTTNQTLCAEKNCARTTRVSPANERQGVSSL